MRRGNAHERAPGTATKYFWDGSTFSHVPPNDFGTKCVTRSEFAMVSVEIDKCHAAADHVAYFVVRVGITVDRGRMFECHRLSCQFPPR